MNASLAPSAVNPRASAATAAPARLDLYAPIHKALRAFLSDTLVRIGRVDVADRSDLDPALDQLEQLLALCSGHVRHENDFVHTAIEAREPAGAARIAAEHADHLESIGALRQEAAALRGADVGSAAPLALRLYRHLALFVAENFQHMHIEETVHNALLWQHYSDDELHALNARLLASVGPAELLLSARWMLPAATPDERAAAIAGARSQMPPEALLGLLAHVRPHLDEAGWSKLAGAAGVAPDLGR